MDPKDAKRREAAERDDSPQTVAEGKPITGPFYPSHEKAVLDGATVEFRYSPDPRIDVAAKLFPSMLVVSPTQELALSRSVQLADQLVRAVSVLPPLPGPTMTHVPPSAT